MEIRLSNLVNRSTRGIPLEYDSGCWISMIIAGYRRTPANIEAIRERLRLRSRIVKRLSLDRMKFMPKHVAFAIIVVTIVDRWREQLIPDLADQRIKGGIRHPMKDADLRPMHTLLEPSLKQIKGISCGQISISRGSTPINERHGHWTRVPLGVTLQ